MCDHQNCTFVNRNLLWYNERIKGGFLLWLKLYLSKWAAHTQCRATIVCQILSYLVKKNRPIGVWGQRRLRYLKQHRKILYYNLLTSGKLYSHLADVEEEAQELFFRLVKEYAEREGVTEQLKVENPMEWVRRMNDIHSRVQEIVLKEVLFV